MTKHELIPTNGRKSFYHKAVVQVDDNGDETLYSYSTPIIKRHNGKLIRLYNEDPSHTTCCHIKSFCGLNKPAFLKLDCEE